MTPQEIRDAIAADPALQALVPDSVALAAHATFAGHTEVRSLLVTTRSVRALPSAIAVERKALLDELKAAATATPPWLVPVLVGAGITDAAVQAVYADDLASAWDALNSYTDGGGIDVGAEAARGMLDLIAIGVPAAAAACVAVKAMAEQPAPVSELEIRRAIWADDGTRII